ncbi:MAG: CCA tRNA nucleotidyltransferase [SAR324 cluster bacterium]
MIPPAAVAFPLTPELVRLAQAVGQEGGRTVLVGGWVRDCLLGIPHSKDFDLEVFGMEPERLKGVLTRFGPVHTVGRHFGVLKLTTRDGEYDVSVPRRESKTGKGHRGFWVTPDPAMTFEQAAGRRDFTINAMGYSLVDSAFLDPFRGYEDLRAGLLRHVGPAFGEDPLRVLRAMQFAGRFRLSIVPETIAVCRQQNLTELARERLWEEFRKLLLRAERPSVGLAYAPKLGVLTLFPELALLESLPADEGGGTPWLRTLAVVDRAAALQGRDGAAAHARLTLLLAALSHELGRTQPGMSAAPYDAALAEAGAAPTESWLTRLTSELDVRRRAPALVRNLPQVAALFARRGSLPPGALPRLALKVPIAEIARLAAAREAVISGSDAAPQAAWLREAAARDGVWEKPLSPLLKGRHLLELGLTPGPHLGELIDEAYELQLDGQLTTLPLALAWARARIERGALPRTPQGPAV